MRWGKGVALVAVLILGFVLAASSAYGVSSGITRPQLSDEGCVCHGPGGGGGVPNANVRLAWEVAGNPMTYTPGSSYNLTFGAAATDVPAIPGGNQGGFNLQVNVGELRPFPGEEMFVEIGATKMEATHTSEGDRHGRIFRLVWKAPAEEAEPAIFKLFVNTVNGDGSPNELDHWNGGTFVVMNKGGTLGAASEIHPDKIGVRWLAHWVGVISFVAVLLVLILYYFVLKYGETVHATDHRDRKET